jgi:hypothetical protein
MPTMYVKMADLIIRFRFRHPELADLFSTYRAGPGPCDMDVCAPDRAIADITRRAEERPSPRYAEFLALSEAVSARLPLFGGALIHAACLSVDGRAYLFLAPSGTGKTTHMRLWMNSLGPRAAVINGDKPFLRLREGGAYAYGSPWAGKENLHANARAPLAAMIFLERATTDELTPLAPARALPPLVRQVYMPRVALPMDRTLQIIDKIARLTPAYLMRCTMRESAARVAIEGTVPSLREAE